MFKILFLSFLLDYCTEQYDTILNKTYICGREFNIDPNSFEFRDSFNRLVELFTTEYCDMDGKGYVLFNKKELEQVLQEFIDEQKLTNNKYFI